MTNSPPNPEAEKELRELAKLLHRNGPRLPTEGLKPKEALALLGYITNLEKITKYYRTQTESISAEKIEDEARYDKRDLDSGLIKLVGLAAAPPSTDRK
jgi:hypothetical protein